MNTPDSKLAEYYAKFFCANILRNIYENCEKTRAVDRETAINRIAKFCKIDRSAATDLCEKGVKFLQSARLTMNFDLSNFDFSRLAKTEGRIINCLERGCKPQEPQGYVFGRARLEENLFHMEDLFRSLPFGQCGRYESTDTPGIRSRGFHPFSRPIYCALDVLSGANGAAATYGYSFLVFKDYVKAICTYAPVDTMATDLIGRSSVAFDKLATFYHMERLIANMQNDRLGYDCFGSFIAKFAGKDVTPHRNYGRGGRNNYIDVQLHGQPYINRDVDQIYLSRYEADILSRKISSKNFESIMKSVEDINKSARRKIIVLI
ncbi:DUF3626 domain-containing protein [Chelatococcus asaccharovorans]|uniref:Uncharacterized protein DUF3626 n=1 Tax=Chelatococcus asaccharovorans TaxID=28210 RepID=A0A2V3UJA4_9HYPH|nr:DUF3626 domain-containing protein [Chelatococcus asaccharovorans]MBS7706440.1 DUF3626 domain-containing protein [Chelatococcus asaccharovorans]PXW64917.1 uncharacterized protein DUF3626 [Chelatococcus asaccharovorans]